MQSRRESVWGLGRVEFPQVAEGPRRGLSVANRSRAGAIWHPVPASWGV